MLGDHTFRDLGLYIPLLSCSSHRHKPQLAFEFCLIACAAGARLVPSTFCRRTKVAKKSWTGLTATSTSASPRYGWFVIPLRSGQLSLRQRRVRLVLVCVLDRMPYVAPKQCCCVVVLRHPFFYVHAMPRCFVFGEDFDLGCLLLLLLLLKNGTNGGVLAGGLLSHVEREIHAHTSVHEVFGNLSHTPRYYGCPRCQHDAASTAVMILLLSHSAHVSPTFLIHISCMQCNCCLYTMYPRWKKRARERWRASWWTASFLER